MTDGLRGYPEYGDSGVDWLGDIPSHWLIKPLLGEYEEKQVKNTGLIENTVLSLSYGRIVVKPVEKLHGLVPASFETYQIVDPGDIIIRPTDLQNDHTSFRIGFSQHRGIITSAYMCLRTWNDLSPEYGYHVLNVFDLTKAIYGYGSGLRQNLSFDHIKRVGVPVPPPEEQAAIVRFLDAAEARIRRYIRAKQKLIKLLNEQKQAIIQQTVTHGLNPDVPMKASGVEWLGAIPAHWEVIRLKYVADILRGKFTHRPRNDPSLYDGPYPFIQTGSVARAKKNITEYSQTLNDKGLSVSKMFPAGTLVMTIAANIGDVAVLTFDACFPDSIVGFVPVDGVNRDYLFYVLSSMKNDFLREAPVNTQGNLNIERVGKYFVAMPPFDEQIQLVNMIESNTVDIFRATSQAENQIDLIREYRTRLIADVVTGKMDVRGLVFEMPEAFDEGDLLDVDEDELLEDDVLEEVSDAE